jgi:hypothetical protein
MEKERAERIKNYNRQRDAKDYFTEITWDENVPQGKELEAHDDLVCELAATRELLIEASDSITQMLRKLAEKKNK